MMEPKHKDVRATPTTVQFNDPPRSYQVENFAIGLENPIDDVDAIKDFFSNSIMTKIPRFTSLLVKPDNRRQHYWKTTRVEIDHHFTITRHNPNMDEEAAEDALNDYLAELAMTPPMSTDKPLWEVHALVDLRCLVLRVHHSIGDGFSLASLIREIGCSTTERSATASSEGKGCGDSKMRRAAKWRSSMGMLGFLKYTWFSTVFFVEFLAKFLLLRDKKTVLNAKDYVDNWPQKIATARFNLDDINLVKMAIPKATINDIMCGIIWGGLLKYINARSSTVKEGQQITGLLMANLRAKSGFQECSKSIDEGSLESWWGNKAGVFTWPIYYTKKFANPLDYVRKAKFMLDRKKQSMEPRLVFKLRNLIIRIFGVKVLNYLLTRGGNHMTFGFSNVVGPPEQISIAGNPVKFLRLSLCTSPMRILMHLMSYTKNLDLQILVAEDVIPDPKFLASCFKDTLQEMKDSVNQSAESVERVHVNILSDKN